MLLVRWLHVLGMAVALGGAVVTWSLLRQPSAGTTGVAERYERLFWAAVGVLVATGVGNLGELAPGVPGPGTRWGTVLTVKLALLVVLLAFSLVRTLLVRRAGVGVLRVCYGATTVLLVGIVGLAEVLAHGA